jgi:prepilin-type N-terminal cleavage/methylation domain-containing protein
MNKKGFTLVELLVVIVIIGILATGAVAVFSNQSDRAKIAVVKNDVGVLNSAQSMCLIQHSQLECSTNQLLFNGLQLHDGGYVDENNYQNPITKTADGYALADSGGGGAAGIVSSTFTLSGTATAIENDSVEQFKKGSCAATSTNRRWNIPSGGGTVFLIDSIVTGVTPITDMVAKCNS